MVVERGADLGQPDALALEIRDRPEPGVPELLLHDDGDERITRPLAPLVGHDPELLAAQHDIVERRRLQVAAHRRLARGERMAWVLAAWKNTSSGFEARLLEKPFSTPTKTGAGR